MIEQICRMIEEKAGLERGSIGPEHDFSALDSLEFVELVAEIEERFGVRLADESVAQAQNVSGLAGLVAC